MKTVTTPQAPTTPKAPPADEAHLAVQRHLMDLDGMEAYFAAYAIDHPEWGGPATPEGGDSRG